MSIFTKAFWRAAGERCIKTFAQTEAALLTAAGTGLLDTDWQTSLSVSGMAAIISLLTSVASDALTSGSGPSLTNAEVPVEEGQHRRDDAGESAVMLACVVALVVIVVLVLLGVVR